MLIYVGGFSDGEVTPTGNIQEPTGHIYNYYLRNRVAFFNKTCVRSSLWSMKRHFRSSDLRSVQMDSIQIIQFTTSGVRYGTVLRDLLASCTFSDTTSVLKQKAETATTRFCYLSIFDRTAVICI